MQHETEALHGRFSTELYMKMISTAVSMYLY